MSQHFTCEKILWPSNMDTVTLIMQSEKSMSRPYGGRSRIYQVGMNLEVQQNKALGWCGSTDCYRHWYWGLWCHCGQSHSCTLACAAKRTWAFVHKEGAGAHSSVFRVETGWMATCRTGSVADSPWGPLGSGEDTEQWCAAWRILGTGQWKPPGNQRLTAQNKTKKYISVCVCVQRHTTVFLCFFFLKRGTNTKSQLMAGGIVHEREGMAG